MGLQLWLGVGSRASDKQQQQDAAIAGENGKGKKVEIKSEYRKGEEKRSSFFGNFKMNFNVFSKGLTSTKVSTSSSSGADSEVSAVEGDKIFDDVPTPTVTLTETGLQYVVEGRLVYPSSSSSSDWSQNLPTSPRPLLGNGDKPQAQDMRVGVGVDSRRAPLRSTSACWSEGIDDDAQVLC